MKIKSKNVTFTLPPELVDRYKFFAQQNLIPSVNAGVKEALEEYSIKLEKEILKDEMKKAANDPLFMSDLKECTNDFDAIEEDLNKEQNEW
ncbi:hypothetical protein EHS13_10595 [Paenibacillus psychroresistens]|uniref:CopG family transcriptional regulator n=1 Tax=Paenibacillus psychroresistens TaxID=1778678 RepID=A0A6B8RIB6_9BACL|nr:hypothetical protein [Paenibacillus psychroresistens]QGQ95302.1 hypothetical protein EHS13_10595 [Paenibacillus psychroresistens]